MPGSAVRLRWGVWSRGIQADGSQTSAVGMRPGTLGPFVVDVPMTAGGRGTNRSVIRAEVVGNGGSAAVQRSESKSRLPFDSDARPLGRFREAKASDRKWDVTTGALEN